ncbi:phytochelatin synthase family protein [Bradyrhizobium sp. Arg237L]|uniref:phytochelatin synthase family protein n=1 Tax=Bradyrhizobium sp. Arg237L TaxID=3003352 RepID=UPI00249DEC17|nr:phytochelatin synthase family protein [Bradyrhizobium sp. Arg237L]MDI4239463.1 phytochelatin synthase family protein [Bradyrhizobium sp. Arg237L]
MKRWHYVSIISLVVAAGLLGAGALVVGQSRVPSETIASSVTRTPELIERAWHLPVAATFHNYVSWQTNGSRCGPAAVANAYRSLGEAASTEGKVLAGTGRCWTGVCILGLTLDELAEVARANTSRKVTVLRDLSEDQFLEHLRRSNDPGRRYIVNFDRAQIFGASVGHHSPIGGYLEGEDLVFVLDVNSDYQPWLVERKRLFAAVNTFDGDKKRGLLLIE